MIFDATVTANGEVAPGVWILRLNTPSDHSDFRAGAFFHLRVDPGPYPLFRRAYSMLSASRDEVEILYKVAGMGSAILSKRRPGEVISVMGPLGNTFTVPGDDEQAILVAGGIGMPPILRWAENLMADGIPTERITFIYGARNAAELVLRDRIEALGVAVQYATDDGSMGTHGLVTDLLGQEVERLRGEERRGRFYGCGPGPMLAALTKASEKWDVPGEISLETPMPCGSGVCLGCIVPCKSERPGEIVYRRTCIDGPVFAAQEVVWR